jgi:hypothetical protein
MVDNNKNDSREDIARAYAAVQAHVLPGLGDAWDVAGPAVVLVMASILADIWLDSGFETFDLIQVVNGVQRNTMFGLAR